MDQSCNQKPALSPLATSLVCKNGCSLPRILEVTVSRSIKPVITSKLQRKMTKYEEKLHVFLTKADIFTLLVNVNVPKPLKNLCTQFDADTL